MAKCQFFRSGNGGGQKVANGTFSTQTSGSYSINIGFKPKYLAIQAAAGSSATDIQIYDEDYSTTLFIYATSSAYSQDKTFGSSTTGVLYSIDNNGFTMNKSGSVVSLEYMAIG